MRLLLLDKPRHIFCILCRVVEQDHPGCFFFGTFNLVESMFALGIERHQKLSSFTMLFNVDSPPRHSCYFNGQAEKSRRRRPSPRSFLRLALLFKESMHHNFPQSSFSYKRVSDMLSSSLKKMDHLLYNLQTAKYLIFIMAIAHFLSFFEEPLAILLFSSPNFFYPLQKLFYKRPNNNTASIKLT